MANADNRSTATQRAAASGDAASKDNETQSRGPVTTQTETETNKGGFRTTEAREENAKVVDERLEGLNEQNREGHDKNIKKIEDAAKQAADNSEKGPTSGREWNRNTPRIDKDGNKHWY